MILILLVVPLVMFPYDFINIKYSVLQMGTLVVATFCIFFRKKQLWIIIKKNPLTWFILAFFITALLSISGAQNYLLAFEQLKIFISFIILFYLASLIHSEVQEILIVIVISATVVAGLSMLQYIWGEKFIYSTLGNPNYIAEFLGMVLISSFSLFLTNRKLLVNIILGLIICILYTLMLMLYGRGALIGFICGVIIYIFLLYRYLNNDRKYIGILVGALFSGLIIITLIFFSSSYSLFSTKLPVNATPKVDYPWLVSLSNPLSPILSSEKAPLKRTLQTRWDIWQDTWKLIKDNFLIGVGIGNYELAYRTYRTSLLEYQETRVTRAHNDYLQVWAEQGILGLIAFIAFFIALFWNTLINLKNIEDNYKIWIIGLLCSIINLMINNFFAFGFYNPVPAMLLWVMAGLITGKIATMDSTSSPTKEDENEIATPSARNDSVHFQRKLRGNIIISIILIIIFIAFFFQSLLLLVSEVFLTRAINYYYDRRYIESLKESEKAFKFNPNDIRILELHINAYQQLHKWESSIIWLNYALSLDPNYALFYTLLGDAFLNFNDYGSAIASYQSAIRIFPFYARPHLALGIIYFKLNRFKSAISVFEKIKLPESSLAHAYNILSIIYDRQHNYALAIKYGKMAVSLEPNNLVFKINLKGIIGRTSISKKEKL